MIRQFSIKSYTTVWRLGDVLLLWPKRMGRLILHLGQGIGVVKRPKKSWEVQMASLGHHRIALWWGTLLVYLLECLGIGELYEVLTDLFKFNTRPLYQWEVDLAKTVYGDNINYSRVRIDEYAVAGPRQKRFCYVSFYLINSWGPMRNKTLIHELMHIWQYEKMGALYMVNALRAQQSAMAYNYGGVDQLKQYLKKGQDLLDFNPEQQADIIADFFLLKNGYAPQWGCATEMDLAIYKKFIEDLDKE
jgi:hypothetical protein